MFNIKIYDISGTFKDTLVIKESKTFIIFTAAESQGQGQCVLRLNKAFENTEIVNTDIIRIYKGTTLIYTGIVQDVKRIITNTYEEIELPLLGLGTVATYILYKYTGSYIFSRNQDPSQTIRDIIDYINTIYPGIGLNYDGSSIVNYGTLVDIDFDHDTCLQAIQKCIETTNFKFTIDQSGKVYFRAKPILSTHEFTVGKDVESISFEEDSEKLVNKLLLKYKSGTLPYEDLTSQSLYGLKEKYLERSDLVDIASADEFGNNYITTYKNPINKTSIVINSNFPLENIKIGDTIKIKNFKFDINNLQIVKYSYSTDKIKLDLELFDSFGKEFTS